MLMSPVGLRPEKDYAGDVRQKLKTKDPNSRQRGRPTSTNPKLSKKIKERRGKIGRWSQRGARHKDGLADGFDFDMGCPVIEVTSF
jgi:hypothetical protein